MILSLVVVRGAHGADAPPGVDSEFADAIAVFQPFWAPGEAELKGIRVVIYPDGGSATQAQARNRDDLCLWTASHLYHLVRNAGGYPALKRPDDRPADQPFEGLSGLSDGAVVVRLMASKRSEPSVAPACASSAAGLLANSLTPFGFVLDEAADQTGTGGPPVSISIALPEVDARSARIDGIPAHRFWAQQIFRGLTAFVAERAKSGSQTDTDVGEDDPPVVPFYPKPPPTAPLRRAVAAIWPQGPLPASRAAWFCNLYVKQAFSDRTNVWFDPQVTVQVEAVTIGGTTNHTALLRTLETALRAAGVKTVQSEMKLLPEQGRLDADRWFGACVAPMAMTFARSADSAPLQSQLFYGEPLYLLDREEGFYLVQGGDGYVGWVRENCVLPMARAGFKAYTSLTEAELIEDVALDFGRVVRGSKLRVVGRDDGSIQVGLPDGKQASLPVKSVRLIDDAAMCKARAKSALELLHVPYLFAGRSSVGLDCSGLVGTICDQHGCVLPRDAAQQFVSGSLTATRWYPEGLRAGDRIYFINETGKIFHTGLSLGGTHFVHSSPPGVQINSLRKGDRLYREHWDIHFLGARRP